MADKQSREFDIVVYGATGYTGRLVAEHFVREYGASSANNASAPKWAMAGRSQAKLEAVRDEIGAPADTPLIVADADAPDMLDAMCKRARVVLTTVGPYTLYGEPLVKACVANGTDYADLTGEPTWIHDMIGKYDAAAKASGAHICFSAGFDSIPFDLGVFMLQHEAKQRFGKPAPRVRGRVRAMEGTWSGGTAASMKVVMQAMVKNPSLVKLMSNPFALTPGFDGPDQPGGMIPRHEKDLDKWAAPFVMAGINTKNVHRTNFLLGHPYGEDFRYDEMVLTSPGEMGKKTAEAIADGFKNLVSGKGGPKPGEGPTPQQREEGFYDVLFIGEMEPGNDAGQTIRYGVKGQYDPGYGSTSRMLAETGMALLHHDGPGGIGTPGSFLGEKLVERLQAHAALSFAVED